MYSTHSHDTHHHLRVGDRVTVRRDVLAELGRMAAGLPPTWYCVPAGTPGRLIGWRDARAVIDLDGTSQRVVVLVGEGHLARAARQLDEVAEGARGALRREMRPARPATRRTSYRSRHRS